MGWCWYGAKTVYRLEVFGKTGGSAPRKRAGTTLVEERVVLLRARGFEEARKKAEATALSYAQATEYTNAGGERVKSRYLGVCSIYKLFDVPRSGVEVYSDTRLVPATVADRAIANRMFSPDESERLWKKRLRFIQGWVVKRVSDQPGAEQVSTPRGRKQR